MGDPVTLLRRAVDEIARQTAARSRTGVSHEDADDAAGSFETDDAIGFDPFPVLRALHEHGARVVVMGQVAGIMHGSTELTGDLDLLWDGEAAQFTALADAFAAVDAQITDADGHGLPCAPAAFLLPKVFFRTAAASGDCCTPRLPWGELDISGIIDRADVAHDPDGLTIRYVIAPDLITMRRAVGRPKDLRRADELAVLIGEA
jgi:hypothetical protein